MPRHIKLMIVHPSNDILIRFISFESINSVLYHFAYLVQAKCFAFILQNVHD